METMSQDGGIGAICAQARLDDVAEQLFTGLGSARREAAELGSPGALPLVSLKDMAEGRVSPRGRMDHVVLRNKKAADRYAVRAGDTLLAARGTVFKVAWVGEEAEGAIASSNVIVVRPGPAILPAVLYGILRMDAYAATITGLSRGTTGLMSITPKDVGGITVPVPSCAEQERLTALIAQTEVGYAAAVSAAEIRRDIGLRVAEDRLLSIMTKVRGST